MVRHDDRDMKANSSAMVVQAVLQGYRSSLGRENQMRVRPKSYEEWAFVFLVMRQVATVFVAGERGAKHKPNLGQKSASAACPCEICCWRVPKQDFVTRVSRARVPAPHIHFTGKGARRHTFTSLSRSAV